MYYISIKLEFIGNSEFQEKGESIGLQALSKGQICLVSLFWRCVAPLHISAFDKRFWFRRSMEARSLVICNDPIPRELSSYSWAGGFQYFNSTTHSADVTMLLSAHVDIFPKYSTIMNGIHNGIPLLSEVMCTLVECKQVGKCKQIIPLNETTVYCIAYHIDSSSVHYVQYG